MESENKKIFTLKFFPEAKHVLSFRKKIPSMNWGTPLWPSEEILGTIVVLPRKVVCLGMLEVGVDFPIMDSGFVPDILPTSLQLILPVTLYCRYYCSISHEETKLKRIWITCYHFIAIKWWSQDLNLCSSDSSALIFLFCRTQTSFGSWWIRKPLCPIQSSWIIFFIL